MKTDRLDLRLMDCMELMREFPDKHFDLADFELAIAIPHYSFWHASIKRAANRKSRGIHGLRRPYFKRIRGISKRTGLAIRRIDGYRGKDIPGAGKDDHSAPSGPPKIKTISGLCFQHKTRWEKWENQILHKGNRHFCAGLLGHKAGWIPASKRHADHHQYQGRQFARDISRRKGYCKLCQTEGNGIGRAEQGGNGKANRAESSASLSNAERRAQTT